MATCDANFGRGRKYEISKSSEPRQKGKPAEKASQTRSAQSASPSPKARPAPAPCLSERKARSHAGPRGKPACKSAQLEAQDTPSLKAIQRQARPKGKPAPVNPKGARLKGKPAQKTSQLPSQATFSARSASKGKTTQNVYRKGQLKLKMYTEKAAHKVYEKRRTTANPGQKARQSHSKASPKGKPTVAKHAEKSSAGVDNYSSE